MTSKKSKDTKSSDAIPTVVIREKTFAHKLGELLIIKQLSRADIARAVWGTYKDPRGFQVAKNRGRISAYLAGTSVPNAQTMKKFAKALDVPIEELEADVVTPQGSRAEIQITAVAGVSELALLEVYRIVPMSLAAEVSMLIAKRMKEFDN